MSVGTQPAASNQHDWRTEQARAWHPAGMRWGSWQPGGTWQAQDHIGSGGDQLFWGPEVDGCIPSWSGVRDTVENGGERGRGEAEGRLPGGQVVWGPGPVARAAPWRPFFMLPHRRAMAETVGSTWLGGKVEGCFKLEKEHGTEKGRIITRGWALGRRLRKQRSQGPGSKLFIEDLL